MWSRPIIILLLICIFDIVLAAKPKPTKPKQFSAQFQTIAKGKVFKCKITLVYKEQKGTIVADKKRSKVSCSPDAKGNFGAVKQNFEIGGIGSVEVTIVIKKGKDVITGVSVVSGEIPTTPGPVTTPGGPGVTGGPAGPGVTGGPGETGVTGEPVGPGVTGGAMSCSCKAPLLPTEMFPGNALMGRMAGMALSGRSLAGSLMARGGNQDQSRSSLAPLTGSPLESLFWLGLVSVLAALAAYGKVTLLESLGLLTGPVVTGRVLAAGQETPADLFSSLLAGALHKFGQKQEGGRQFDLGGLVGGLVGGAGGTEGLTEEITSQLMQQAINQWMNSGGMETLLTEFVTGGGAQSFLINLLTEETESLSAMSQSMMEALEQQMDGMDVDAMMEESVSSLGSDLGEIASALQDVMENMPPMESPSMDLDCTCVPAV